MSVLKNIIIPFLIGGTIISGVKYSSTYIKNPAIAAIIGGIPTGLISIYFIIDDEKTRKYVYNYFFVTLSLLISICIFYALIIYTKLNKNIILIISLCLWVILISIRYFLNIKDTS